MDGETGSLSSLSQTLKNLPPEQVEKVLERFVNTFIERFQQNFNPSLGRIISNSVGDSLKEIGYNEEAAGMVHLLAAKSNDSKEAVLQKALTLYGLALDALEKGNRLAVIRPDDVIVHDVVGFEPAVASAS